MGLGARSGSRLALGRGSIETRKSYPFLDFDCLTEFLHIGPIEGSPTVSPRFLDCSETQSWVRQQYPRVFVTPSDLSKSRVLVPALL